MSQLRQAALAYARALMRHYGITVHELLGESSPPPDPPMKPVEIEAPREDVAPAGPPVTVCPSVRHDVRYQVPPGARVDGAGFVAEWNRKLSRQ